ncbi:tryptophan--tRNA ligase [Myxococcota bacterium]|nr:tryptophan--tRNA ligase [Myxococcota bacterium]
MSASKKRVLTGVKPTGVPHIGNYLGAIRPALELTKDHDGFLFIADLHALTTRQDPAKLREETYAVAATWLSLGLDPKKVTFYKQSDIPEVTELAWVLSCFTSLGLLNRAHSIKDARDKGKSDDELNHGVFTYPVLMAADILLFDIDLVPVGKDQKQHLEITQEAARKLNNACGGDVLKVPEALIDESVMTVPGLDGRKMSKSYDNTIELFSTDKQLLNRVKGIKTNSTEYGAPLDADTDTIFQLYKLFAAPAETDKLLASYRSGRRDPSIVDASLEDPTKNYFGWGQAKQALYEIILDRLGPARKEYDRLMADKPYIRALLREGAERARATASVVLGRVYDAVGIVR